MTAAQTAQLLLGLFLAYFATLQLGYLALLVLGVVRNVRETRHRRGTDMDDVAASDLTIPVSVVIPAYNEEGSVENAVRSALDSHFPELEVLVVDDGSTDGTFARLEERFDLVPMIRERFSDIETEPVTGTWRSRTEPRLWVIRKENGGKGDAGNVAVNVAHYPFVLLTDADCVFEPDGLLRMIRPINFRRDRIIGLGANMRSLNGCEVEDGRILSCSLPGRWVERFQTLEYATVFVPQRSGWSAANCVPVVSGGLGLWRTDALRAVGGYSTDTTHEDLDTTLRLHAHFREQGADYAIDYLTDTAGRTEVPHTWRDLYVQRRRWQRHLYEAVWRNRRMTLNPRYGAVGAVLMPYLVLYEGLGPFVELAAWLATAVFLALGIVSPGLLLAFLATAAGLVALLRLASVVLDLLYHETRPVREVAILGAAALLEFFLYRPFLLVPRLHGFVDFLRGHTVHERADRIARSDAPVASH